ncbi:MAG TPA: DEAD/DEAH box helicase [Acidimicrobiia bacterium]|nr:DEAD/DEAH box helicase [Acidimicrobiia bacterium]
MGWDPELVLKRWDEEDELSHRRTIPPREARFGSVDLDPLLKTRLGERGIENLYLHQTRAIDAIRAGRHTMLSLGTASGKSLAFQIPILERIIAQPKSTALLIYPTKALAQDQARSMRSFKVPLAGVAIYDGDTPPEERPQIRRRTNIVLTNPDMLHLGILPFHSGWSDFFHRLAYVVIDEVHHLRGVFGTHVAFIIRRLRRICEHYGASPTLILASATIGNAAELAEQLTGLDVEVIEGDYSPAGERSFALWNPGLIDPELGLRRSALGDATYLFAELVKEGGKVIAFTRGRKSTELMYRWAAGRLPPELAAEIAPYRAGYTPAQRRLVESRLFGGQLAGVIATNALELGIDVGGLDAAVITTFPGTMAAFRQQAGRAGRSGQSSLVVLVAGDDALDQYLMRHPQELFERPSEAVVVNPSNPLLAAAHLACAAYEKPLELDDRQFLGPATEEVANSLVQSEHLKLKDGKLHWAVRQKPAPSIDLRASGGPPYTISAGGKFLGTLDQARVNRDAHPGAIYLHQGDSFLVQTVDHQLREVGVRPATVDYYTQTRTETDLGIVEMEIRNQIGSRGVHIHLGMVDVENQVVAYQKRHLRTREVMETVPLDLPSYRMTTSAVWLTIPDPLLGALRGDLLGSLHAAEHAGIAMLPLMAVCDRWDLGGLSTNWHPDTGSATIFIHEGYPGGAGIAPIAYERRQKHWQATRDAIAECPCVSGCPSCVQSPKCGNLNEPLSKSGAVELLDVIL